MGPANRFVLSKQEDLPDLWAGYVSANAEFFTDIGSPKGAAARGGQCPLMQLSLQHFPCKK